MKDYNYITKIHEEIMPHVTDEVIEEAMKAHQIKKNGKKRLRPF
jgi:hypothetical protein